MYLEKTKMHHYDSNNRWDSGLAPLLNVTVIWSMVRNNQGVELWTTIISSRIIAHFLSFCAIVTWSLARLSSAYCALVRSTLWKILWVGRRVANFFFSWRALIQSSSVWKQRKRVALGPIHARSKERSCRSNVSWRKEVPTCRGSTGTIGTGSPFRSWNWQRCSSCNLICTTPSTIVSGRGGGWGCSLFLTTSTQELSTCCYVSASCLKRACYVLTFSLRFKSFD